MPQMPGGVLMSRLKVYDSVAPDGQRGGTPHVHLACSEVYVVVGGSGAVEMIDRDGFKRVDLAQGDALVFSPGTVHRLINPYGDLDILVIMQNSGLPERGDNVVSFPDALLADGATYADAMRVTTLEEAYLRRDRGVAGFMALAEAFAAGQAHGRAALERFYLLAEARTRTQRDSWQTLVEQGPGAAVAQTQTALDALARRDMTYLFGARQTLIRPDATPALGFCGHLQRYFDPATLTLEGIRNA